MGEGGRGRAALLEFIHSSNSRGTRERIVNWSVFWRTVTCDMR